MRYSVYDYDRKVYSYYEGSGPKGTHAGAPPVSIGMGSYGATLEQASWKLPPDARKVGEGDLPIGRIATTSSLLGLGDIASMDGKTVAVVGALAYLAWRYVSRRRHS